MSRKTLVLAALAAALLAAPAWAHPEGGAHEHGIQQGFLHPFTGLDHLLVMVAVGVWAAHSGLRLAWIAPACFLAGMAGGMWTGLPFPPSASVELVISLSVVAFGLLLVFAVRAPLWAAMVLALSVGIVHGAAHAAEAVSAMGALAGTLLLHAIGVAVGAMSAKQPPPSARQAQQSWLSASEQDSCNFDAALGAPDLFTFRQFAAKPSKAPQLDSCHACFAFHSRRI